MIKSLKIIFLISVTGFNIQCNSSLQKESVSFYQVPLVCGAAPEIGCGSRIKPLFLDLEKESMVQEAWTNREGTILAIKWKNGESETEAKGDLLNDLFKKHNIDADYISDEKSKDTLLSSLASNRSNWLKGMEVDSLSLYEAGVISYTLTDFAAEANLISGEEQNNIRTDIENYFRKELVKVRTDEELKSEATQAKWRKDGFQIYQNHLGKQRAEAISNYFDEHEISIMKHEGCCSDEAECESKEGKLVSENSIITCPNCGHKKQETLPTEVCLIKYECEKCHTVMYPKDGDCCVFCSHGDHKCPSKQEI